MKTIIIMLTMAMASSSYAQKLNEGKVPDKVKTTLEKRYPEAEKVKWDKENQDYEASFEQGEVNYSVLLNTNGKVLETEGEIKINQLPDPVLAYMNTNYPKTKIKEAARIVDSSGTVTYEAESKEKI